MGKSNLKLPASLIRKEQVTIFPEGAIGYLVGPTLAATANAVLANYFNAYMSNVLNINRWASWFFAWIPVISVVFVIMGNILVGRLMDHNMTRAGKARPLILLGAIMAVIGGSIGMLAPSNFPLVVVSFVIKALGSTPAMKEVYR